MTGPEKPIVEVMLQPPSRELDEVGEAQLHLRTQSFGAETGVVAARTLELRQTRLDQELDELVELLCGLTGQREAA